MIWIAVAILVVGLFALLPSETRAMLVEWGILICGGLLCLALLAGIGLWLKSGYDDGERAKRREHATNRIGLTQVRVENATLSTYGEFKARIFNDAYRDTLETLELRVVVRDCLPPALTPCDVVSQNDASIHVLVPPLQARDVSQLVIYNTFTIRGKFAWTFDKIGTVAAYRW